MADIDDLRGSDRISCVNDRPYILDFRSVSTYRFTENRTLR